MENQENTNDSRRSLHIGQFLWHLTLLALVVVGIVCSFRFMQETKTYFEPNHLVALALLGWFALLLVLLILFSARKIAAYEPGKPLLFQTHLRILTWLLFISCLFALLLPAVQAAREAARRIHCSSLCKQLTLAFYNYHDQHGSFPPAYTVDENGKPLHSWRVLLLPYLEQNELYKKIRLDEPWDSEYNRQFHHARISHYRCPSSTAIFHRGVHYTGNCNYSVVIGNETLFPGAETTASSDISDGSWSTILIVERIVPINWMDPNNEIRFDTAGEGINRHLLGIGSNHLGGANVGFADGRIQFLKNFAEGRVIRPHYIYGVTDESLKSLLTKSAGD